MWTLNILIVFLVTSVLLTAGIPIASPMTDREQVSQNPTTDVRGLFLDFYKQKMQDSHNIPSNDFGEKITDFVSQTAVAMADAGEQTVQQIVGTMGVELVEALKF